MKHGTVHSYKRYGCRCDECTHANRAYKREWRARHSNGDTAEIAAQREAFADLLHELFPFGLSEDAPCRRKQAVA
jgi:hypothetical protein